MNMHTRRIFTKPTLKQRFAGLPLPVQATLVFMAFFILIGVTDFVCAMAGFGFDPRLG